MKKIVFLLFVTLLGATAMAQSVTREGSSYISNYGTIGVYDLYGTPDVTRVGETLYYNGSRISLRDYKGLLRNTSPEAYYQFNKGKSLTDGGWSTFVIGNLMVWVVGGHLFGLMGCYHYDDDYYHYDDAMLISGIVMSTVGGALMLSSIPMLAVGYTKRHRSVDLYNEALYSQPDITYNITAGENGIGFAINF